MSYIEEHLVAGEKVFYTTKIHPVVFLTPAILLLISAIDFINHSAVVATLLLLVAVIFGLSASITYSTSEIGVTNKRVLVKTGFLRRRSLELLLSKVEGITVDQGIMGRILGFGTIIVSGVGGTKEQLDKISAPFEFRKLVQEQVSASQRQSGEDSGNPKVHDRVESGSARKSAAAD